MVGGDENRYVGVDLLWCWSRNCHVLGIGAQCQSGCVNLVNWTLVSCGVGLESYRVGGGDGFRYVGVDVSLDQVMAEQRSLGRLFTLILVGLVLPYCLISCILHFAFCKKYIWKILPNQVCLPELPYLNGYV